MIERRTPTKRPFYLVALAFAAFVVAFGASRQARAQDLPTLSGSWSASGMSELWTTSEWGPACGPKPGGGGAAGGMVQVSQTGNELAMNGAGRSFSTGQCWEQMPGLSRTSHSGGARAWRNRCATPANDSRQAQVVTSISATDTTISIQETGQYQFGIEGQTCKASVTRSRTMKLVQRAGEAPAASATATAPAPVATAAPTAKAAPAKCAGGTGSGDPARLEVHPGHKVMQPGERFVFRAVVLDASGCALATRPSWRLLPGPLAEKATVDATGALALADDAPSGKLELVVAIGDKGVTLPIDVASGADYDALLGAADAGDAEDDAAVAVIATAAIGGRTALAEDLAKERKLTFVAIVAGIAALLGFVGLVLARRGKHAARDDEAPPSSVGPPPRFSIDPPPESVPKAPKKAPRGKICPTCGEHYPAEASFCGKDATTLVLLN